MKPQPFLAFLIVALFTSATVAQNGASPREAARKPVRVLLVVAHPDDEYEVAGTVYRISKELLGTVDQVIITDGEAGYRYSSLAVPYYGIDLTNEAIGRTRLPRIREEEARRARRILGIRRQWFLNERDDRFSLDAGASLHDSWHEERILHVLQQKLSKGHYDFVFVLLPTEQTHGEHKAASILALEAVELLPAGQRPIVLGAQAGGGETAPYKSLSGYPLTASDSINPQFQFDRNTRFGYQESLSYQIVVDWVIAEHKSQGLFQTRCLQDRFENFWLFTLNRNSAAGEAESLFAAVTTRPERAREIGGRNCPAAIGERGEYGFAESESTTEKNQGRIVTVYTKQSQIETDVDWVHEVGRHIARGDTLDEALAATVSFAIALVNCDRCFIYVREGIELALWVWKHLDQEKPRYTKLPLGKGYTALLAEHRVPMAISTNSQEQSEARIFDQWSTDPGETFVSVPLLARKELVGVINLQHHRPRRYSLREVKLLSSVGFLLGADIGISRLENRNSDLLMELETRKLVERGKGILQRELGLSEHEAFLALQHQSQQKKRPMKEIAQAIILSAEVRQSVGQN